MTLNGRKGAFYGAHQKKMNEDRPKLSFRKCRPITLVPGYMKYMRTFAGVPRVGGVKRQDGTMFSGHFTGYAAPSRLFSDPQMHDLEWPRILPFHAKFWFACRCEIFGAYWHTHAWEAWPVTTQYPFRHCNSLHQRKCVKTRSTWAYR